MSVDTSFSITGTNPFETLERWADMMRELTLVPMMSSEARDFIYGARRNRLHSS